MITIAQYRGKSFVSWLIKKQTRSVWSHTAAVLRDGSVIESWHVNGVSHVETLSTNHSPGTTVDLFRIAATNEQADIFEAALFKMVGLKYDFSSVFRFLSHTPAMLNDKFFCTEAVDEALRPAGIYLQSNRICPAEMSPQIAGISSSMLPVGKIVTGKVYDSEFLYNKS